MTEGLLYNPHYCIASAGATCILLIVFFMKRNYSLRSNKIFFVMLIDNLLASLVNITTFFTISSSIPLPSSRLCEQYHLYVVV